MYVAGPLTAGIRHWHGTRRRATRRRVVRYRRRSGEERIGATAASQDVVPAAQRSKTQHVRHLVQDDVTQIPGCLEPIDVRHVEAHGPRDRETVRGACEARAGRRQGPTRTIDRDELGEDQQVVDSLVDVWVVQPSTGAGSDHERNVDEVAGYQLLPTGGSNLERRPLTGRGWRPGETHLEIEHRGEYGGGVEGDRTEPAGRRRERVEAYGASDGPATDRGDPGGVGHLVGTGRGTAPRHDRKGDGDAFYRVAEGVGDENRRRDRHRGLDHRVLSVAGVEHHQGWGTS